MGAKHSALVGANDAAAASAAANEDVLVLRTLEATCVHAIVPEVNGERKLGGVYLGSQFAAGHRDAATGAQLDRNYVLKRMRKAGIRRVLCVTVVEDLQLDGIQLLQLPFSDSPDFDLMQVLERALAFIADGVRNGEGVLVHCQMGQSRSAAIVTAFLMRQFDLPFGQAFSIMKARRSFVSCEKFGKQLLELEDRLRSLHNPTSSCIGLYPKRFLSPEDYSAQNDVIVTETQDASSNSD